MANTKVCVEKTFEGKYKAKLEFSNRVRWGFNSPVYTHSSSSPVQDQLHLEDPSQFSQVHYSVVQSEHSHSINYIFHHLCL